MYACEIYACEIYACEMHAYEMHAHEMHAHEIHTCQMLPGIPELFLGAFLLLGKTHRFPGTLKQFLGISIAPVRVGSWRDEHKLCGDGISNVARGWLRVE